MNMAARRHSQLTRMCPLRLRLSPPFSVTQRGAWSPQMTAGASAHRVSGYGGTWLCSEAAMFPAVTCHAKQHRAQTALLLAAQDGWCQCTCGL